MHSPKDKKQKLINKIERLSAIFAAATFLPAMRATNMRLKHTAQAPLLQKNPWLAHDHVLHQIANELAEPLGVTVNVEIQKQQFPLFGAYTYPMKRKKQVGRVNEVCIAFIGNPAMSPDPEALARSIIAHELGHVEQLNSPYYTCATANQQVAILGTLLACGLSFVSPAFFPFAFSGMAVSLGLTIIKQWEQRCNEYLADLRGAKISGSHDDAIKSLLHLKCVHDDWQEKQLKGKEPSTLSKIFNHEAFSTHPPIKKRVQLLQEDRAYKDHKKLDIKIR